MVLSEKSGHKTRHHSQLKLGQAGRPRVLSRLGNYTLTISDQVVATTHPSSIVRSASKRYCCAKPMRTGAWSRSSLFTILAWRLLKLARTRKMNRYRTDDLGVKGRIEHGHGGHHVGFCKVLYTHVAEVNSASSITRLLLASMLLNHFLYRRIWKNLHHTRKYSSSKARRSRCVETLSRVVLNGLALRFKFQSGKRGCLLDGN